MQCDDCGFENTGTAKFCAECGSRLARRCASCGAEHGPTAKFCDQCGERLRRADPSPTTTIAVRKQVTAMFADLAGATAFGDQVDPETVRAALAPYFEILRTSVEHHDGMVVKFTGDGVMAVFGLPEVAEDDALRAVSAGQELQRRFETFAEGIRDRHGVELGLRVGINSGELVVGDDDADLVGDVLNTAARLEAACSPGRIAVGEDTWRLTRSSVTYEVLGEVTVKGKSDPIAVFEVAATAPRAVEGAIPFIGRAAELDRLLEAFADARRSTDARLVTVIGPPGVGKTRLASELRAATEARSFDLRVERRGSTTFGPIADLLRAVTDGSADAVDRLLADHDEETRLTPILQSFLGHGPVRSTEESFWAIRRLVEHLVDLHGPIVVVVDDIQWAEPLFWDLLDHLVEWASAPVLIVALARPELRELRPELAQPGRRVAAAIELDGLDDVATRELAAKLLGTDELPAELVERLPASTEGNPLFVRELVHMLVEDGTLAPDGDRWRLTIDADAIDVPPTILSLLASRVERLPDDERQVVELASVIGTEFDRGTLAAIARPDVASRLGALIDRLRRKDLVEPTGSWVGDHPVYRFHHVLLRDAAYRRILKARRAELHERVGELVTCEATGTEEQDVVVAHHFEQVVHYRRELGTVDDRTNELAGVAVERLRRAADQALEREDLPAAGGYAERALDLVAPSDRAGRDELLVLGCEALLSSGDVAGATPLVRELHDRSTDDRLAAWADCFRAQRWSLTDPDRLSEAADLADDAAGRLDALDDQAGVAKGRLVRAACLARLGQIGACESELDLALGAARAAGDRRRTVAVLGAAPLAALWGPSPVPRAGGRCLDVLRLLRITTASPAVEATSLRCQGVLEALRGRFDSARDKLEASRATARELGLHQGLFETEFFAGFVEMWARDPVAAEPHLRAAREGLGRLGIGADAGQAGALLARARLRRGDIDEADALAVSALTSAGENLQTAMSSRAVLAEIRAAQGRHDDARRLVDEAIGIAERTDVILDHAIVLLAAQRVATSVGDDAQARRHADEIRRLLDAKGVAVPVQPGLPPATTPGEPLVSTAVDITAPATEEPWNVAVATLRAVYEDQLTGNRVQAIARLGPGVEIDEVVPVGVRAARITPVTTCADHLALVELGLELDDRVVEHLVLVECRSETIVRTRTFPGDDPVAGHQRLLERWAETGGPVAVLELFEKFRHAMLTDDSDAFRSLLHPDFRAPDHRTLGPGDRSADDYVRHSMSPAISGVNTSNVRTESYLDHRPNVALQVMAVGTPEACTKLLVIFEVVDGLLKLFETFDRDDEDHARRRFAEITRGEPAGRVGPWNPAMRLLRDAHSGAEPIAVRDDHLALAQTADGRLLGVECDGGAIVDTVSFPATAATDALDWLDERWIATGGPAGLARQLTASRHAIVQGDAEALRAVLHPDLRLVDHRGIGPGDGTVDDLVSIAITPELRDPTAPSVYVESFLDHTDDVGLNVFAIGPPEARTTILVLCELVDGRQTLYESFDLDDVEHARRRYAEVVATAATRLHHPLEALTDRFAAHFFDDSFDEIRDELFEPDFVREDRRRWVTFPDTDLDGFRAAAMAFEGGTPTIRRGPVLAIRTNCYLGTAETVYSSGDSNEQLVVVVEGSTGRIGRMIVFDPDEITAAQDELDRQWALAGGDARFARLSSAARWAAQRADRDALAEMHTAGFRSFDHRSLGLGERDLDAWIETLAMFGPGVVILNSEVVGCCDRGLATSTTMISPDGTSRWEFVNVWEFDRRSGKISRQDLFGDDQRGEATARYQEIAGNLPPEQPTSRPLENAASRLGREMLDAFRANDREAVERTLHPDLVSERRTDADVALGAPIQTRDDFIDDVMAMTTWSGDVTPPSTDREIVAIRGDDLYLSLGGADFGGNVVSFLTLGERVDGRLRNLVWFEPDRLHDALDELDRRWVARGGPAALVDLLLRLRDIYRGGTNDDFDALVAPDYVSVDHRPLGMGVRRREDFLASMAGLAGNVESYTIEFVAVRDRAGLGHAIIRSSEDGSVLLDGLVLSVVDRLGRWRRNELFGLDQLDEARARFDELVDDERWETFDADQIDRASERFGELTGDDGNAAFRLVRRLPTPWEHDGLDIRVLSVEPRPIAVRGDELCLTRATTTDGDVLLFVESESGRIRTITRFGSDEVLDAEDELDHRWAARGGPAHISRFIARFRRIFASGTVRELEALVAPDYVSVDHRQIGFGTRDRSAWLDSIRDFVGRSTIVTVDALDARDHTVLTWSDFRVDGDWALVEGPAISQLDESGQITRMELFDPDDMDGARRRFDELVSRPAEGNAAWRIVMAFRETAPDGKIWIADRWRRLLHPDFRSVAHGRLDAGQELDREQFIDVNVTRAERADQFRDELRLLAWRGDELCLLHSVLHVDGDVIESVIVAHADVEQGVVIRMHLFDEDQLAEAAAELDRLWIECGGRVDPVATRIAGAMSLGSFEDHADCFAADFVCVDHREVGFGTRTRTEYLDTSRSLIGQVSVVLVLAEVDDGISLSRVTMTSDDDGSTWELYLLQQHDGERATRWEQFPIDALDEATARFREIERPGGNDGLGATARNARS